MHTNETTHFQLPIFVANDTPAWLVDWNGAMNDIDSALYSIQQGSGTIATDLATVQTNLTTLEGIVESQGTSISSLASALTSAQGTINTITSLIGNGVPTTTDKTIIGAINEINEKVDDYGEVVIASVTADGVKTFSQLANELYSLISDLSQDKINASHLVYGSDSLAFRHKGSNLYSFSTCTMAGGAVYISQIDIASTASEFTVASVANGGTVSISTSNSSAVAPSGAVLKIVR